MLSIRGLAKPKQQRHLLKQKQSKSNVLCSAEIMNVPLIDCFMTMDHAVAVFPMMSYQSNYCRIQLQFDGQVASNECGAWETWEGKHLIEMFNLYQTEIYSSRI